MSTKNSNRQIGDRPKVVRTIRIDADLDGQWKERSELEGVPRINILEAALRQYLE